MAYNFDLSSTPTGYQTPEQQKQAYEIATALQNLGNSQRPITHWSQGVTNMLNALIGGSEQYKAGLGQQQAITGPLQRFVYGQPPAAQAQPPGPATPAQPGLGPQSNAAPYPQNALEGAPSNTKTASLEGAQTAMTEGGSKSDAFTPDLQAYMPVFKQIESGGDPNQRTGSYSGLYQLSREEAAKYGTGEAGGQNEYRANANWFAQKYGRPPTPTELYLVAQQGRAGLPAHLANPDAPAWQNMANTGEGKAKGENWAKRAIWGNIPDQYKPMFGLTPGNFQRDVASGALDRVSSASFMNMWQDRIARGKARGEGGAPSPMGALPGMDASVQPSQAPTGKGALLASAGAIPIVGDMISALASRGPTGAGAAGRAGPPPVGPQVQQVAQAGSASPYVPPPYVFNPQSRFTPQDLINIGSSPYAQGLFNTAYGQYMNTQVSPRQFPGLGGTWVMSPNGQMYFSPSLEKSEIDLGGMKVPTYRVFDPTTGSWKIIQSTPQTLTPPPVTAPPATAPAGRQGAVPLTPGPEQAALLKNAPAPAAAPAQGTQVASLSPVAAPMGALGTAPPKVEAPTEASPPLVPAAKPPEVGTQVAQAGERAPGTLAAGNYTPEESALIGAATRMGVPQEAAEAFVNKQRMDRANEIQKSAGVNAADQAEKRYRTVVDQGSANVDMQKQLELAQNMAKDPKNPQGIFTDPIMFYNRVLAQFGMPGGTDVASTGQAYKKLLSSFILNNLRQFTQGASVGQIRTAEIDLAKIASASTSNTPEANMALLNIAHALAKRSTDLANLAINYKKSHTMLDAGWDEQTLKFQSEHPLLSNEQIKEYRKLFGDVKLDEKTGEPVPSGQKAGATPTGPGGKALPKEGDIVKGYQYIGGPPESPNSWRKAQ